MSAQLERVDLGVDTLTALFKLLSPHVPHSLSILGTILNSGPRPNTLQNVDPSNVSLWSTTPLHSDANPPALFSIVAYSNTYQQFRFFCSAESNTHAPTEAEETHVQHVFERLRDIAGGEAYPTYAPFISSGPSGVARRCADTDPPTILVGGVDATWAHALAPVSTAQRLVVRYFFPRGVLVPDDPLPLETGRRRGADDAPHVDQDPDPDLNLGLGLGLETSQLRASDVPFVSGASTIPRSEAYILSRMPYSVCFRSRARGGQPVGCALMHSDGSIGALRVDAAYRRRGLGRLVVRALAEKLAFSRDSDGRRDVGGGALGWHWAGCEAHNEPANRLFTSLGGRPRAYHWTDVCVDPSL